MQAKAWRRPYRLDLIKSGKHSARKLNRAWILLLANEGKADSEIAAVLHTGQSTVQRNRQRFVEGNLEGALNAHCMQYLVDDLFPETDKEQDIISIT
jgi:hypothetical protein